MMRSVMRSQLNFGYLLFVVTHLNSTYICYGLRLWLVHPLPSGIMRRFNILSYSFFFHIFLLDSTSYAQPQLKVFDTESGLSSNFITKVIQYKTGYLWVGT